MANSGNRHVVTGEGRLSYVHVFEPWAGNQGEVARYSLNILLPKTDTATKARIDAAIEAARQDGMARLWNGQCPPSLPTTLHDGDGLKDDGSSYGPECRGCWVLTARTKNRPRVVDANVQDILNQGEVYSGCYGRVAVDFVAYNNSGKRGVTTILCNVQKLRDGKPLGGGSLAEDDFGGAPYPAPAAAPAYGSAVQGGFAAAQGEPAVSYPTPQGYSAPGGIQGLDPITGLPRA